MGDSVLNQMKRLLTVVPALALAAGLSACGGGGDAAPATPPPKLTGVFTDAPVGGLNYTCSPSGLSGTTDAEGHFEFRDGDTVVFSVGSVAFPPVTATGTVTPREIAAEIVAADGSATVEDVSTNLFVFFQSLDTDDDPNTVTFPDLDAVTFSPPTFTVPPATFQEEMATSVAQIEDAVPGLQLEVVTVEEALAHAAEQGAVLLAGTWRLRSTRQSGLPVDLAITFFPNGTYLKGGLENDSNCDVEGSDPGGNGAEFNTYEWNSLTGEFTTGVPQINTDGGCGLEGRSPGTAALQVQGDELRFYQLETSVESCANDAGTFGAYIDGRDACVFTLTRADNEPTTIVGSFGFRDFSEPGPTVLTIERTGASSYRYILVEANKGRNTPIENTPDDNTDGIEIGTFTLDASGITQGVTPSVDTNDSGGLDTTDDPDESFRLTIENGQLQVEERQSGEVTGLFLLDRLPQAPRFSVSQLAGLSLFPEEGESNGIAHDEANLLVFTFFADGTYIAASHNNDPNCDDDYINAGIGGEVDPDGNGMEWARWQLDPTTGQFGTELFKPLSETNGSCGLYEATHDNTSRFFIQEIGVDELGVFVRAGSSPTAPESFFLRAVPSEANSLIGSWTTFSATDDPAFEPEVITFFSDGSLISGSTRQGSDEAGVERLQWSLNEAGTELTLTASLNAYPFCMDTIGPDNSCTQNAGAGVTSASPFSLGGDGRTATIGDTTLRKLTLP